MKKLSKWFLMAVVAMVCLPIALISFAMGSYLLNGRIPLPVTHAQRQEFSTYITEDGEPQGFYYPYPYWSGETRDFKIEIFEGFTVSKEKGKIQIHHYLIPLIWEKTPSPTARNI